MSRELADFARLVWSQAKEAAGGDLSVPAAVAFEGWQVGHSWRAGSRWLAASVVLDDDPLRCEWCFCDTETDELFGEDQSPGQPLPAFVVDLLSTRNFWRPQCLTT